MGKINYSSAGQGSVVQRYFHDIKDHPLLSRQKESQLGRETRKGRLDSRNALVEANLGFVAMIAKEYTNRGLPYEDLLQEGNLGLIEAADKFDPERGVKFISYAVWYVRTRMVHALANNPTVHLPQSHYRGMREFSDAEYFLSQKFQREPTREEVSQFLEESGTQAGQKYNEKPGISSTNLMKPLDEQYSDSQKSIADFLPDPNTPHVVEDLSAKELKSLVRQAVSELSDKQREVIKLRDFEGYTLRQIGERVNLSFERVRQIEIAAKKRLKEKLKEKIA